MIIAIDGPAGSGKSTVAKQVARTLGFQYLDTGAMYRSVAWYALQHDVALDDEEELSRIASGQRIEFTHEPGNPIANGVAIGGADCTRAIRTPPVDASVSAVSAVPGVRSALVGQQRAIAAENDIVMEGRDIGTVVFPHAELKVFLTASAEERARRRAAQNAEKGYGETDAQAILAAIRQRDEADSSREVAPLAAAGDAVLLDTTGLSIAEVVDSIAALAARRAEAQ